MIPVAERLWSRVEKSDGCWRWTGNRAGGSHRPADRKYGLICVDGKDRLVHRVAYELLVGPIPQGLELDHLCRNTACVNPAHLEPVTHAENMRRGSRAQATRDRGYRCSRHLDQDLVLISGDMACRICRREANVRYRRRLGGGTFWEGVEKTKAKRTTEERRRSGYKAWVTRRARAVAT